MNGRGIENHTALGRKGRIGDLSALLVLRIFFEDFFGVVNDFFNLLCALSAVRVAAPGGVLAAQLKRSFGTGEPFFKARTSAA